MLGRIVVTLGGIVVTLGGIVVTLGGIVVTLPDTKSAPQAKPSEAIRGWLR